MYLRKRDRVHLSGVSQQEIGGGIHPFHEILYISEGTVVLQWIGTDYTAASPALFLLPPYTPHLLISQSDVCQFGYIELDMQDTPDFPALPQADLWNSIQADKEPQIEALTPLFQLASGLWLSPDNTGPFQSIAGELIALDIRKLLLMINTILQTSRPRELNPVSLSNLDVPSERIQAVIRHMESNYQEALTVNQLASSVHLDVSYFIHSFQKIASKTPLQYLHDLRFNAATCFLSQTKMTVQEITRAVGFQSIHYFSRLFKQRYGISPSMWRKQHSPQPQTKPAVLNSQDSQHAE
ncbi:AraC family transcriptional regulator [Paenibacillus nasutitermitis]|uniref:HTH araC/xylS-type domain-containing protein n=1 Tax=Paenibacillus nasutitermitis TaxID=1652958 RepID=A0A917DWI3_9BACL|nr:AraC family transcriptional regulator [Paenibacillus nasutitermitis]GGD77043.1 hypothetical protein GCM10010911_38890 [Paenibacillus nasutitermitis]